jgi:SAM-dependent methyltransferase
MTEDEDALEKDPFLNATLWQPKVRHDQPRFFPRTRQRAARIRWYVASRLLDLVRDRGISTAGQHIDIDHFHPDRVWYEPSNWTHLRRMLKRRDVEPDDVFVDYGCGKGRILYQAARLPFKRVIGVEIAEDLAVVARANVKRVQDRLRCSDVEVITADAATWPVPDDVTVAYFYYPFVGDTFKRVIDNIVSSLERAPRRMRIIYAIPTMEDCILATGRFRIVKSHSIRVGALPHRLTLYETVEAPS